MFIIDISPVKFVRQHAGDLHSILFPQRHTARSGYPTVWKTRSHLFYIFNVIAMALVARYEYSGLGTRMVNL